MKRAFLLFVLVLGFGGCCTYKGKVIPCRDAKNMEEIGMDVKIPCGEDNCGKETQ